MGKLIFTTSWDDGSVLDLKVSEILSRHGMTGTFYIPKAFDGTGGKYSSYDRRLNDEEIRKIAFKHEVGGHSLSHRRLTDISPEESQKEIAGSQEFLGAIIGKRVDMFAFPGGKYEDIHVGMLLKGGFAAGRIARKLSIDRPQGVIMNTTVICQPFPFRRTDASHYYWKRFFDPLRAYEPVQVALSWGALARKIFAKARREGDYFHLYGHSWELEKYGMWKDFENFLIFVKSQPDIIYATNGEVMKRT